MILTLVFLALGLVTGYLYGKTEGRRETLDEIDSLVKDMADDRCRRWFHDKMDSEYKSWAATKDKEKAIEFSKHLADRENKGPPIGRCC